MSMDDWDGVERRRTPRPERTIADLLRPDSHPATVSELARWTGLSVNKVRYEVEIGAIPVAGKPRKQGSKVLVNRDYALDYLVSMGVLSRSEREAAKRVDPRVDAAIRNVGVYFARCDRFIKIGCSDNVKSRIVTLNTASPLPIELVAVITLPYDEGMRFEAELHERFRALRHRGEWFRSDEPLTSYLAELSK